MSIQVNIFEAGSVPTAQELATLINELNTTLDESVTLTGEQSITGVKTFLGSKLIKFKQSASADKLGFTLYDYQGKEVGNFEYDNKNNFRLLALGNYVSAATQEVECNIGFKIYNKLQSAAYRLLCPLAGNAKNSIPSLTDTYTNFYMPLVFTNGAASVMADNNGKVDLSTLIGSGGGDVSGLATVATTGDYNDLLNRPILFSGNYNDLTNKPTLFSGSYGDLTDKPTLFSGDYNDLINKPIIPVVDITKAQADGWYQPKGDYALTEDLFSGNYNDLTDKPSLFSGDYNDLTNKPSLFSGSYNDLTDKPTLFSGSYNDLSNKPTIPTVPAISTNIANDASSDTKTASPKAVKDFVEGKGYLTQHQDISGKADRTDLVALENRVEALEQGGSGGGDTTQYSYLKLIPDLDAYTEAPVGEIVKFVGKTGKYTRGWDYEKVSSGEDVQMTIASDAIYRLTGTTMLTPVTFPFEYSESVNGYFGHVYGENHLALLTFSTTPSVGDVVIYWDSNDANPVAATITNTNEDGFSIDNNFISLNDLSTCKISKFINTNNQICFVKDSVNSLSSFELAPLHERFYTDGTKFSTGKESRSRLGLECETFDVDVKQGSVYIESIDNEHTTGRYFWTGKNAYNVVNYDCDSMGIYPVAYGMVQVNGNTLKNGATVYKGSFSGDIFNVTGTDILSVSGSAVYIGGYEISGNSVFTGYEYYEFINANGDIVYIRKTILTGAPKTATVAVFSKERGWINASIETKVADSNLSFTVGTPSISWQPILMPTANN